MHWMTSQKRKVYKRAVNKVFRCINDSIKNDSLWRGRFIAIQDGVWFTPGDTECPDYLVRYHFRDLKTNQESHCFWKSANEICFFNGSKLFWEMNDFIVKECNAWGVDDPRLDTKIYR